MPYKRRRKVSSVSGSAPNSSSPASRRIKRNVSVARTVPSSSPAFNSISHGKRVSLKLPDSPSRASRDGSVARPENVFNPRVAETDAEIEEREGTDLINEIMMAIDVKKGGNVGCAYYVAREETLYLMQDIASGDIGIVDTLKLHVQPTTIIISTRADEDLEQHLSKEARGIERGEDDSEPMICLFLPILADSFVQMM